MSPMPWGRLLGELPELGLDAAVPHAHAGQRRADVPRGTCGGERNTANEGQGTPPH